jgi:hypothetical protein
VSDEPGRNCNTRSVGRIQTLPNVDRVVGKIMFVVVCGRGSLPMSARLLTSLALVTGLLIPSFATAQTASPAISASSSTSDWFSVVPVDAEHVRVTLKRGRSNAVVYAAKSAEITYTTARTVVDIKGPVVRVNSALGPITVSSVHLTFTDGKLYVERIEGISLSSLVGR